MPNHANLLQHLRVPESAYARGTQPYGVYEKPRFLLSGDEYVMVEFGDRLNIVVNCKALAFSQEVTRREIGGVVETCVGQLSILIHFDPSQISLPELILNLKQIAKELPPICEMMVPSRLIEIPVVFHDRWTRECAEDYSRQVKPVQDNCEVVIRHNGLKDLDDLVEHVTAPEHWVANLGWMPGNANAFPLDPRYEIQAPKYNPSRLWTYEGTLGVGTSDKVIYPLRSAGGYQMIGRTPIRVYDPKQRNKAFKEFFVLPRVGDRLKFYPITEEEFYEIENRVDVEYRYRIHPYGLFSVKRYLVFLDGVGDEAKEILKNRPWAKTP